MNSLKDDTTLKSVVRLQDLKAVLFYTLLLIKKETIQLHPLIFWCFVYSP